MSEIEELEKKKESKEQLPPENLDDIEFKPMSENERADLQKQDEAMVAEELPKLREKLNRTFAGERAPEQEEPELRKFSDAKGLEDLYSILEQRKTVKGSQKEYSAAEIKDIIQQLEDGQLGMPRAAWRRLLLQLPNADGLRRTAEKFLVIPDLSTGEESKGPKKLEREREVYDIKDVQSLKELYKFLDAERYVTGNTGKEYSAQYIKDTIEELRAEVASIVTDKGGGKRTSEKVRAVLEKSDILKRITTAGGLQQKVIELVIKEGE